MRRLLAIAGAMLLAVPASAFAQDETYPTNERTASMVDRGLELQALGGGRGYVGQANDILNDGAAYGVLLGFEPTSLFGIELGYQGANFKTDEALPGTQNNVTQQGGYAMLKLSPMIGVIEPYAVGGFDISRVTASGDQLFVNDQTVYAVPVGAGIDFHVPVGQATDLMIGARGTYAFGVSNDNTFPTITNPNSDWVQVAIQAGAQF